MEQAPIELRELATAWLRAGLSRNTDFLREHSHTPEGATVHTIASVPGGSLGLGSLLDHLDEAPPRELVFSSPEGFVHGDTAWFFDDAKVDMLYDGVLDMRFTIVFVRVDGAWKAVHSHLSEGVVRELGPREGSDA
ncbi:nuclear transport factor 2 family protein [Nonomuraea lactucae]|uniref:nuclear transport factor 2 family protein n=1 Tax=Nonomuraea lactucae TaxID=2249762 RepID=UPI0013B409DF|nr:nuclear transport factor 2 family protein [Nonomuraea lactucae]